MLPYRGQAARGKSERKAAQRWELVPLFGWISENPFDRACIVIEGDDKVFSAGNDQRIIRAIVMGGVVMEPVGWRRINELAGIISSSDHCCADNVGQVSWFQQRSG